MDPQITLKPGYLDHRYNDDKDDPLFFIDERYRDSMAKAMEDAFKAIWPEIMKTEPPVINNQLRMMFTAIAQGVVQHLVKNAKAISVILEIDGNHLHSINYNKPEDTENTSEYLYFKHKHQEENSGSHTHLNNDTKINQAGTLNL